VIDMQKEDFEKLDAKSLREYINLNSAWIIELEQQLEAQQKQLHHIIGRILDIENRELK